MDRVAVLVVGGGLAVMSCGGSHSGTGPLPVSADVAELPGEYALFTGSAVAGRIRFPAADAGGAQYLIVGQFATGTPDVHGNARLIVGEATSEAAPAGVAGAAVAAPVPVAQRFHDMLRSNEAAMARVARFAPAAAPRAPLGPPVLGSRRTFKVCGNLNCDSLVDVPATVKYAGAHAAIYLDDSVPSGGFTQSDLDGMGGEFDSTLYGIDHTAFGAESDIDGNGVVIILLTRKINALVPEPGCQTSFVTGFFYGADIAPGFAEAHNNGEIFYGFVPDPAGLVSCPYATSYIRAQLPVTFIHEFQHMISFNQHVLVRGGGTEILWLNEGLSHIAEELGGLHFDSLGLDTTANRFAEGDFYNGYLYLSNPNAVAMVTDSSPGSLPARGGDWLFLRYVADQFGPGVLRALDQTALTGDANVVAATGVPLATLLGRWSLAVYASDLPGFSAPADLSYRTWSYRAAYQAWHDQLPAAFVRAFPLDPATSPTGVVFDGSIGSGSGAYVLVTQPASGAAFDVTFRSTSGGALPSAADGQVAVLRIR